jgi:hypothetical protein
METKSTQPLVAISFEKVINRTTYVYDIHTVEVENTDGSPTTEYVGTVVSFIGLPTENNIKREVLNSEYDADYQHKLENEAILALLEGRTNDTSVAKFHTFALRRQQLFMQIEHDVRNNNQ